MTRREGPKDPAGRRRTIQWLDLFGILLILVFLGASVYGFFRDSDGRMARETLDKYRRMTVRNGISADNANVVPPLSFSAEQPKDGEGKPEPTCDEIEALCCKPPPPPVPGAKPTETPTPAAAAAEIDCPAMRKRCCPSFVVAEPTPQTAATPVAAAPAQ